MQRPNMESEEGCTWKKFSPLNQVFFFKVNKNKIKQKDKQKQEHRAPKQVIISHRFSGGRGRM